MSVNPFNQIGDYYAAGADPNLAVELFLLPFSDQQSEAVTSLLKQQNGITE